MIKFEKVDFSEEKKKINKEDIKWDIDCSEILYEDRDERMIVYLAEGIGQDSGKRYEGSAEYCCEELIEITNIVEV